MSSSTMMGVSTFFASPFLFFPKDVHGSANRLLQVVLADVSVSEFLLAVEPSVLLTRWSRDHCGDFCLGHEWAVHFALQQRTRRMAKDSFATTWRHSPAVCLCRSLTIHSLGRIAPTNRSRVIWQNKRVPPGAVRIIHHIFMLRLLADHCLVVCMLIVMRKRHSKPSQCRKPMSWASQGDFAQLDRLLREKPNGATVALEGIVLFSNTATRGCLNGKSEEDRGRIFEVACQLAPSFRSAFKKHRVEIWSHQQQVLAEETKKLEEERQEVLAEKEDSAETSESLASGQRLKPWKLGCTSVRRWRAKRQL